MMRENEYMRKRAEYERSWLYKMSHRTRGFWYAMANFGVEGYILVTDFSNGKVILRFTLKLPEAGEYVLQVSDEHFGEQDHNKYTNVLLLLIR